MHILFFSQNTFLPYLRGLTFSQWLAGQNIPLSLIANVFVILSNMFHLYEGGILKTHFAIQLFGKK